VVDAKLNVLRAGEVFREAGRFLCCQSQFGVPRPRRNKGLEDCRCGECWFNRNDDPVVGSFRKQGVGRRFWVYIEAGEDVWWFATYKHMLERPFYVCLAVYS
jgi:hypothetical protein